MVRCEQTGSLALRALETAGFNLAMAALAPIQNAALALRGIDNMPATVGRGRPVFWGRHVMIAPTSRSSLFAPPPVFYHDA
jgi:hypothetical protein